MSETLRCPHCARDLEGIGDFQVVYADEPTSGYFYVDEYECPNGHVVRLMQE